MKTLKTHWPKGPTDWIINRVLYVSVPFTWNMPALREKLRNRSLFYDRVVIGGPGVYLALHFYPGYLDGLPVEVGSSYPGVLQLVNRMATRTTTGCVGRCHYCGIGEGLIEPGGFHELEDWPDLPMLNDNNLLAASLPHFDRVIDRLRAHGWADFEQGVDPAFLTEYHAGRLAEIKKPMIRLALDRLAKKDIWEVAWENLRRAGIAKSNIRSYALVGFDSDPGEAWDRCQWIEGHGIKVLPMWFHQLDALKHNIVTERQAELGWTDYERRRLMQFYYQHKKAVA